MKKIITLLIGLGLLLPTVVFATVGASWSATSTDQGVIYPTLVNGHYQGIQVPFVTATSTTQTSTFKSDVRISGSIFGTDMYANNVYIGSSTLWADSSGNLNFNQGKTSSIINITDSMPTTETLDFEDNGRGSGNSILFLTSNDDYVGVAGNNNPQYSLDVLGDANVTGCYRIGGNCLTLSSFSGSLAIAHGGTNATSQTTNGLNFFNGTSITSSSTFVLLPSGNVGIGTTSPWATLSVKGNSDLGTNALAGYFTGTTTATSTLAGGLNVTSGCFAISGTCVGAGGSGTVTSVATNNGITGGTITTSGTIGLDTSLFSNNALVTWNGSKLAATGTPNLTAGYFTGTTTATSTLAGGLNVTSGCIAVGGICIGNSTGGGTGTVSTSTIPTVGNLSYWTSNGYPSLLGSVATSSESCSSPLSCTSFNVVGSGGAISLGTVGVANGGTGATSFGQGWLNSSGSTNAITASTSPTVNYITATSTSYASTFPFASTTALTVSGINGLTVGSLTGLLQGLNGAVTASTTIGVNYGGTGITTAPTYGQMLLGNTNGGYTLTATTSLGFPTVTAGSQGWLPFFNAAGKNLTATSSIYLSQAGNFGIGTTSPWATLSVTGNSDLGNSALAGYFTATSSSKASTFPYASTTMITSTTASTTNLFVSSKEIIGRATQFSNAPLTIDEDTLSASPNADGLAIMNSLSPQPSFAGRFYVATDTANGSRDALYIVPSADSSRLYFGDSSASIYAINFSGVQNFESVPSFLQQNNAVQCGGGGNNCIGNNSDKFSALVGSSDGGSRGLALIPGNWGGWLLTNRDWAGRQRSMNFTVFPTTADNYVMDAGYIFNVETTPQQWSKPQFQWTTGSTTGTGGTNKLMALSMYGALSLTPQATTSQISMFSVASSTGTVQLTDLANGNLGIGTTSPWRTLSVTGNSDLGTNALAGSFTGTTTATSTLAGGLNVTSGCLAINGTCLSSVSLPNYSSVSQNISTTSSVLTNDGSGNLSWSAPTKLIGTSTTQVSLGGSTASTTIFSVLVKGNTLNVGNMITEEMNINTMTIGNGNSINLCAIYGTQSTCQKITVGANGNNMNGMIKVTLIGAGATNSQRLDFNMITSINGAVSANTYPIGAEGTTLTSVDETQDQPLSFVAKLSSAGDVFSVFSSNAIIYK